MQRRIDYRFRRPARSLRLLIGLLAVCLALGACGQMGPLYRPAPPAADGAQNET